jgi:hypothetical protein
MALTNTNRRRNNRTQRPPQDGPKEFKEIFGITERGDQSYWTRIGVAFVNQDGSLNVVFNFIPTDPQTRIQIRDPRPREE